MTLNELENAVTNLSADDLAQFRDWFARYDSDAWDRELENDVAAGKLDALAESAIRDHKAGKSTGL
ncbi:MAG: hypothetical protein MI757_16510 [Pirellulales bacterium]|nr:hypothetical protein [Pirellulales bacterium]